MTVKLDIGVERLKHRTSKVREAMRERGLDAVIVFGNPSRLGAGSNAGSLRYLTNWTAPFDTTALVLPAVAEPVLIVSTPLDQRRVENQDLTGIGETRVEMVNKGEVARELIEERCGPTARVGLVGGAAMRAPEYLALTNGSAGTELEDADEMFQGLRLVKEPEEIECHRAAAAISDAMHQALLAKARSDDVWEWELRAAMEQAAAGHRAEYGTSWLGIGPNAGDSQSFFAWESMRKLQDGDQIYSGTYVILDGYWGHAIRGGFKGKPTAKFLKAHDILTQALEAGTALLKPGASIVEVSSTITDEVKRHFPGRDGVWMRSGHALGLDYADPLVSDCFPYSGKWGRRSRGPDPELQLQPAWCSSFTQAWRNRISATTARSGICFSSRIRGMRS